MSTLSVPKPSIAGTSVTIGSAPARKKTIAMIAANAACTAPATFGVPFAPVRASARGSTRARPSAKR